MRSCRNYSGICKWIEDFLIPINRYRMTPDILREFLNILLFNQECHTDCARIAEMCSPSLYLLRWVFSMAVPCTSQQCIFIQTIHVIKVWFTAVKLFVSRTATASLLYCSLQILQLTPDISDIFFEVTAKIRGTDFRCPVIQKSFAKLFFLSSFFSSFFRSCFLCSLFCCFLFCSHSLKFSSK